MTVPFKEQYQNPRWQKKRLEIMRRDKWRCRCCNETKKALHIHHLYYQNDLMIWEYDNESYVTLCEDCHKEIHIDIKKLAGLIAFEIICGNIDVTDFKDIINKT